MGNGVPGWLRPLIDHLCRRAEARALGRLNDHLLADVGLRRDQLDLLHLPPRAAPATEAARPAAPRRVARPSLQGCG